MHFAFMGATLFIVARGVSGGIEKAATWLMPAFFVLLIGITIYGGVVGDVAGFAAATYLRGMRFAQVPTTLLAMMDSSIGGKTGVDLSEGKNLVGAFHHPQFVLDDVRTLQTLPERERISGWAEAIKHGLIADDGLLRSFEVEGEAIRSLDGAVTTEIIARSVAIKADVVSRDERETLGQRVLLNYGHTIAHALEAATGYEKYLHGEAVSIGMMGAAEVCRGLDMLTDADVDRQRRLLEAYGLPVRLDQTGLEGAISAAMALDKKTVGGAIRCGPAASSLSSRRSASCRSSEATWSWPI